MEPDVQISDGVSFQELTSHLERFWGLNAQRITRLDVNVFRVDLADESISFVARFFPAQSAYESIANVARCLEFLAQQGFPAEECCQEPSAVQLDATGACILLTKFVDGTQPERNKETFYRLGKLQGKLHTMDPPSEAIAGGAWHHLTLTGGLQEEVAALGRQLEAMAANVCCEDAKQLLRLRDELQRLLDAEIDKLPQAFVHPDLVPVNVIARATGGAHAKWTVIDWAGAGLGPKMLALGILFAAAGMRGSLGLVNATVKGYLASGAQIDAAELDHRLPVCIRTRLLTISCWEVVMRRKTTAEVLAGWSEVVVRSDAIADRIREVVMA